jgi:hypothetical protein
MAREQQHTTMQPSRRLLSQVCILHTKIHRVWNASARTSPVCALCKSCSFASRADIANIDLKRACPQDES